MKHVYSRMLALYLGIGILCFFLISTAGSWLIERQLESAICTQLTRGAGQIAADEDLTSYLSSVTAENPAAAGDNTNDSATDSSLKDTEASDSSIEDTLWRNLLKAADFQGTVIWLMRGDGTILMNTDEDSPEKETEVLDGFSSEDLSEKQYQTGDFYGAFSSSQLSVLTAVNGFTDSDSYYVVIHFPLSSLYDIRSHILAVILPVFFVVCLLFALFLLDYRKRVHIPLQKILKGASEYAGGNLSYNIPVNSEDEMGYLAQSLNYMAERLNRNSEYQRRFVANISHDFRSPLTSIKGYVEAMLDGTIPQNMQERYLKIIDFESGRLEKLTRSLLTLNELDVKKRLLHKQRFDINDVLRKTADSFEGICSERDLSLKLLLSGNQLFVRADLEQIQQVLYNLLDNAIKFSADHSFIVLETAEKNEKVFVSVKDHGCGISRENLSRIWDRFFKTDVSRGRDRKGTGLGLSIVKEIINAHDQHINVISTEGVGTEFIFTLDKAK